MLVRPYFSLGRVRSSPVCICRHGRRGRGSRMVGVGRPGVESERKACSFRQAEGRLFLHRLRILLSPWAELSFFRDFGQGRSSRILSSAGM